MGYSKYKRWIKSLQTKSSLALLITAAALIELTAAVQYWYAKKGIREEVEQRAKSELKVAENELSKAMAMTFEDWQADRQQLTIPGFE